MQHDADGYLRPPADEEEMAALIRAAVPAGVDAAIQQLFNLDSSAMTPDHWTQLGVAVHKALATRQYDGIVILHGTDTMHYTAAALSLMFHSGLPIPVVLTGAQRPWSDPAGDAQGNFQLAIQSALWDAAEVIVAFHHSLFRGARTEKTHDSDFDAFAAPGGLPLARFDRKMIPLEGQSYRRRNQEGAPADLISQFDEDVVVIRASPGMKPDMLLTVAQQASALIISGFGSGNLPPQLTPAIEEITASGKPVFLQSPFPGRPAKAVYAISEEARRAGALLLGPMTPAMAFVKISWVLGSWLKFPLTGENRMESLQHLVNERDFAGELR